MFARFRDVRLTTEPALDISGAAGVPLMLAMAHGRSWTGHAPGPLGLPGGYPVRWQDGALALDLPDGVSRGEAVGWNAAFETRDGIVLEGTRVRYTGRLHEAVRRHDAGVADGFDLRDLDAACGAMAALRMRLQAA